MSPADLRLPAKFTRYYPGQERTILDLACSDKRFSLLCAPTGAGKSLIYMSLGRMTGGRTLILVSTKALQAQLMRDFGAPPTNLSLRATPNIKSPASRDTLYSISGHSAYPCGAAEFDDIGDMTGFECVDRDACAYRAAVDESLTHSAVVTNYAHWCNLIASDPLRLGDFDLLVIDEAHLVPELLAGYISVRLSRASTYALLGIELIEVSRDPKRPTPMTEFCAWAARAANIARNRYAELRHREKTSTDARRAMMRVAKLGANLQRAAAALHDGVPWVAERSSSGVSFTPVWSHPYSESWLFRGIKRALLCSATLPAASKSYFGITRPNISDYREMPSSFPAANRPIIWVPTTRVQYDMGELRTRKWVRRIDEIVGDRLDRKGLIHARSYARAEEIKARSKYGHVMLIHDRTSTQRVVDRFKRSEPPCVLVSPSVEEGIDFPYDLCRYQILCKIPFLDTRDTLTKSRVDSDKKYSNYVTSQTIMQTAGRIVRAPDDYGETLVIDDHWEWFRWAGVFQQYFRDAWRVETHVPKPREV